MVLFLLYHLCPSPVTGGSGAVIPLSGIEPDAVAGGMEKAEMHKPTSGWHENRDDNGSCGYPGKPE